MEFIPDVFLYSFNKRDIAIAYSIYNLGFKWENLDRKKIIKTDLLFVLYKWEARYYKSKKQLWLKRNHQTFLWQEKPKKITTDVERCVKLAIKQGVNNYYQNFVQLDFFKELGL